MSNTYTPIVSIVMPTYNRADLLPDTLKSILSQEFEDFELLVVDDGSTDNTADVIKKIQARDRRLRYLQLPENKGIGFARDAGLQHVSGKYVALADSDDLWLPGKLKLQVEMMEQYPGIDILFSDWHNVDHVAGTKNRGFVDTKAGMMHLTVRHMAEGLCLVESGVEAGILRSNFVQPATMVLRANIFGEIGGFETTLITMPDHEFGWRAAALGAQYAYLNQALIERHRYQSSVTARIDSSLDVLDALAICRRRAGKMPDRQKLLSHIRAAEQRCWRNIIGKYAKNGQGAEVWRAYLKSLRHGFSVRTFMFFVIGLGGLQAISVAMKLRMAATQTS